MMSSLTGRMVLGLFLIEAMVAPISAAPKKDTKAPKAEEVCVSRIHVIKGCSVCEVMVGWLTQGGVKLTVKKVERGEFPTYPVVVYSDGARDHGDRMYSRNAGIPDKIDVVSCESAGG